MIILELTEINELPFKLIINYKWPYNLARKNMKSYRVVRGKAEGDAFNIFIINLLFFVAIKLYRKQDDFMEISSGFKIPRVIPLKYGH